jgi:uncharacterized protein involved in exopolysaccharide biosynthesis
MNAPPIGIDGRALHLQSEPAVRQDAHSGYTLRDLLTAVFFHRRAMLLAFLLPFSLGLAAALFSRTAYVAEARLLVLLGNDYVFQPAGAAPGAGIALDRDQIVQGELEILQSTTLARATLEQVGIATTYPRVDPSRPNAMALTVAQFGHDLTVSAVPDSNVVQLGYRSYSPTVAAKVLGVLIDRYLQRRAEVFSRGPVTGIDAQLQVFADRLRDAEEALAGFSQTNGISDFDAQVTLLLNRKSSNTADSAANEEQVAQVAAQLASMRTRLAALPRSIELYADSSRAPAIDGLGDALARLQAQRSALLSRYQDNFPLVADADRQIASVKQQMAGTNPAASNGGRQGLNPVWQDLSAQVINLEAQQRGLEAQRAELAATGRSIQTRLDQLNALGRQYRDLKRARDAQDESYRSFVRGTEQTQVSSALDRSRAANIRIVQSPEPPAQGVSLRRLITAAGFLLGLVAATAVLVLGEAVRQSFVTIRDAELGLDLPVLIAVTDRNLPA